MTHLLIASYFVVLGVLALFGVYRLILTRIAIGRRSAKPIGALGAPPGQPIDLVVQLPMYNETFVAERLLRAAAELRYPFGRKSIQVIDDSTDETSTILRAVAEELRRGGAEIELRHRGERQGFKAGALADGLSHTTAPLVAIFDADFVPPPDFLERVVPSLLADQGCAMVQARWGHLNRDASVLTRAQAMFLDAHFTIEHRARALRGSFFNFNGTAGVWRKAAIEDAGGWSDDTITEDLDLSYRAQLAGWRFAYLDDAIAPAELPESWSAFRSQQARWVRGSVETAKKHLVSVLRAKRLPRAVRFDALVHLTNNFAYLLMALLALLLPAAVTVRSELAWRVPGGRLLLTALDLTMLGTGTLAMVVFYVTASIRVEGGLRPKRLLDVVLALCIGAGMSVANAFEVVGGFSSKRSAFVRTPKRGDGSPAQASARYRVRAPIAVLFVELAFVAYFVAATAYALASSLWGALPFLLLYLFGFAIVGSQTLFERWSAVTAGAAARRAPITSSLRAE